MRQPLIILGAGGFAKEVLSWVDEEEYEVIGFFDQNSMHCCLKDLEVFRTLENKKWIRFVAAVGDPKTREKMVQMAIDHGLVPSFPIIHKSVIMGFDTMIGLGSIICPGVTITTDVTVNEHCIVNINSTIGHDCNLEDFVTVSPGANISGNVDIGKYAYIGTGAKIREKKKIGEGAVVGMGATVVKDVEAGQTVISSPARPLASLGVVG